MLNFSEDTSSFIQQITVALHEKSVRRRGSPEDLSDASDISAVLFLLGRRFKGNTFSSEPCLILNKRSMKVKQPGDLCCPGGSINPRLDSCLAKLLRLPFSPLTCWPYWSRWRKDRHQEVQRLALLFATSLRDCCADRRWIPFRVQFLGTLPPERLIMFRRVIYPMACWISRQKRYFPNWEVEKIVYVPIKNLLNPSNYALYRLHIETPPDKRKSPDVMDYPCFIHQHQNEHEVLWGATFRVVMVFLDIVFGFKPPGIESLSLIHGVLDKNYLTGYD